VDIDSRFEDVARLFNKLAPSLGFGKCYIIQGGDVGSKVAWVMAAEHAACKTAHTNFCIMLEPSQLMGTIDELETRGLERAAAFSKTGSAYALEHAIRPSTIAFALAQLPCCRGSAKIPRLDRQWPTD
jgi:microsomal epoxide hydrolase